MQRSLGCACGLVVAHVAQHTVLIFKSRCESPLPSSAQVSSISFVALTATAEVRETSRRSAVWLIHG